MARSHGRISIDVWNDPDWVELPPEAQWLYWALLAQPSINWAGVLPLTVKRWALKLSKGADHAFIVKALDCLSERHFVVIDESTEEVLVRSFIRNDGITSAPNTFKNALLAAQSTTSPKIRAALLGELRRLDRTKIEAMRPAKPAQEAPVIVYDRVMAVLETTSEDQTEDPITYANGYAKAYAKAHGIEDEEAADPVSAGQSDASAEPVSTAMATAMAKPMATAMPEPLSTRGRGRGSTSSSGSSPSSVSKDQPPTASAAAGERAVINDSDGERTASAPAPLRSEAFSLVRSWVAEDRARGGAVITSALQNKILDQVLSLMMEGITAGQVRVALDLWRIGGYGPSQIPIFANDVIAGPNALDLDPDRDLSHREIREVIGGIVPNPLPPGWWDEARREADKLRARARRKIIESRRARTR